MAGDRHNYENVSFHDHSNSFKTEENSVQDVEEKGEGYDEC